MDAIMLAHSVHLYKKRVPKMMAHRAFFDWFKFVRSISESFNLKKACLEEGLRPLKERELLILFPEAETGNFKSSLKRYQLQTFHSGFVRLALKAKAPIIPCLIIGAEESYLNVGSLDLSWAVKGLHLPVPINLFPLPAKWKIIFLDPISFESISHVPMDDLEEIAKLVKEIQRRMQTALDLEIKKRKYIYFPTPELFLE
jgi:1-acyl-sn-glycerol-3-phosphate acyltransferase